MELSEEQRRGELAADVLENPLYREAFDSVRAGIIHAWETAPIRDKEGQGELKLMLKLLTDVQRNLETTMQTGKMAKIQIEREGWYVRARNQFRKG